MRAVVVVVARCRNCSCHGRAATSVSFNRVTADTSRTSFVTMIEFVAVYRDNDGNEVRTQVDLIGSRGRDDPPGGSRALRQLIEVNARAMPAAAFSAEPSDGREMMKRFAVVLAAVTAASPAIAEGVTSYATDDSFEDAAFAVENAIIGRGLVIDYVSHVGAMLSRTGADVGSDVELFEAADVFLFCSAVTSRSVMEADLMNIAYCPYGIFVADKGGEVIVGFRNYPGGPMQEVQALLDEIAQEAVGN